MPYEGLLPTSFALKNAEMIIIAIDTIGKQTTIDEVSLIAWNPYCCSFFL